MQDGNVGKRGYWGDILVGEGDCGQRRGAVAHGLRSGPYLSFGVATENEELFTKRNEHYVKVGPGPG